MTNFKIRAAKVEDSSLILGFVKELAIYEKAESEVMATVEDIQNSLFSSNATVYSLICSIGEEPIGFAVYFYNYSTWVGKNGIYLEDLYVSQKYRGKGAGKALLKHLANIAVTKGYGRVEWSVLDWNEPSIKFYESFGAKPQSEWISYRLSGENLKDFAKG